MITKATAEQVRAHYLALGFEVRISKDDEHVTFRKKYGEPWREGRYVSDYRIIDGEVVLS